MGLLWQRLAAGGWLINLDAVSCNYEMVVAHRPTFLHFSLPYDGTFQRVYRLDVRGFRWQ